MNIWATIILWEGADPETDRIERKTDQETLTIVFANSVSRPRTRRDTWWRPEPS